MPLSERLNRLSLMGGPDEKSNSKSKSKSPSGFKLRLGRSSKHGDGSRGSSSGEPISAIPVVGKGKSTPCGTENRRGDRLPGTLPGEPSSTAPVAATGKASLSETENLWARAEDTLWSDPEKKKIFQAYLEILGQQLESRLEPSAGDARHKQLCSLIEVKIQELGDKKWKLQVGDWNRDIGDLLDKSFRSILSMKELIKVAASPCPPAALACAGATIILTLLVTAKDQESTILGGLRTTSSIICRLPVMEKLYRSKANLDILKPDESTSFQQEFETTLTALYSQILEFQARAACYLRQYWITRTLKGVNGQDPLKGLLQDIDKSEAQAQKFTSDIGAVEMRRWFEDQEAKQNMQNVWQKTTELDKRVSNFLKTIYTCPYKDRKDDRNRDREPGTCEWFTSHPRFKTWNETHDLGILWVSADPGSGKSILAKYLVDQIIPSTDTRTTCYFFFKDDFPDQKSSANAVCALLRQLFIEKPKLLHDSILEKCETDGDKFTASFSDLWRTFIKTATDNDAGEVVCVLDALDECQESDRSRLIGAISELYSHGPKYRTLKFLCTSRPYGSIKRGFRHLENRFPYIHLSGEDEIEVEKISHEIDLVVRGRVKDIGEALQLEPDEISFLEGKLMANPQRTYLWVHLILDHIENLPGFTRGNIERATGEIPQTVNEAYNKILDRSSDPAKAHKLLHAVLGAERPLSVQEIAVILAIEQSHKSFEDISKELEPEHRFRSTLRDLCGLFVVIIDHKTYLLHQTAREFLVGKSSSVDCQSRELNWKGCLQPEVSNRFLAERCIWYLTSNLPNTSCTDLLEYASYYWAFHFRKAGFSVEDEVTAQATSLCDGDSPHFKSWAEIYESSDEDFPSLSTCLVLATYLEIEPVVTRLIEAGSIEVDCQGPEGRTPLSCAAAKGNHQIAKALLETGAVNIEFENKYFRQTPLQSAAEGGHEEVVRLLLERRANVEAKDDTAPPSLTPMSLAARGGHASVVKLLLEMGKAAVDSSNEYGTTPLWLAAQNGSEETVELLLNIGKADLKAEAYDQKSPLIKAASEGHDSVVKLLLEAGARIDQRDSDGDTALAHAARAGYVSVVDKLIKAGAELDLRNKCGQTPLSQAADRGIEGVTKILLDAGADPNQRDRKGRTPLPWAACEANEGVVEFLLGAGADLNVRDENGWTPLDLAIGEGHEDIEAPRRGASQGR